MGPEKIAQAVAAGDAVAGLVDDAGLSWRSDQKIRFLAENLIQATSPSNVPFVNPASAKAVIYDVGISTFYIVGSRAGRCDWCAPGHCGN